MFAYLSSFFSGFYYSYRGATKIDWSRTYIICANHSSSLDITALSLFARGNFAFLGKEELLNNPVTALFFKSIDIPVNRNDRMASFKAFKRVAAYLEKGISVIIFPEGGIDGSYPPQLSPFKAGTFRLAIQQQVPILALSIADIWKLMWDDASLYGSRPGLSHIFVHSVIETAGLTAADEADLSARVWNTINNGLNKDNEA